MPIIVADFMPQPPRIQADVKNSGLNTTVTVTELPGYVLQE